jgi:hypothetical protein
MSEKNIFFLPAASRAAQFRHGLRLCCDPPITIATILIFARKIALAGFPMDGRRTN